MRSPQKSKSLSADTWSWEAAACAASVLCMVVVIVLMIKFDGQPIFAWHGISLNTLVSIGSTLAKTFLLFTVSACLSQWKFIFFSQGHRKLRDFDVLDSASRGPQGSFSLLWHTRFGSLAAIGAIITVLTLAADPFVQQLIAFEQRQTKDLSPLNSLAYARDYEKGSITRFNTFREEVNGTEYKFVSSRMDFAMRSAVMSGLGGTVQQSSTSCSSSNCEWPWFLSLAVCSRCGSVTDRLQKSQLNKTGSYQVQDYDSNADASAGVRNQMTDIYRLPNGLTLQDEAGSYYEDLALISFGTSDRRNTTLFQDKDTLLWAMSVIGGQNATVSPGVTAFECGLYYCVNNYTTTFANGTLHENKSETTLKRSETSLRPLDSSEPDNFPWAMDLGLRASGRSGLELGDGYNMSELAINSIGSGMKSIFVETFQVPVNLSIINGVYIAVPSDRSLDKSDPDPMQMLYQAYNQSNGLEAVAKVFENIATSMTNALRNGDTNGSILHGSSSQVVYRVRWGWLTLPLLTVLGSILFLLLSIQETKAHHLRVWKSSALAVLKCGTSTEQLFRDEDKVGAMEKKAKAVYMSFDQNRRTGLVRDNDESSLAPINNRSSDVITLRSLDSRTSPRKTGYSSVSIDET